MESLARMAKRSALATKVAHLEVYERLATPEEMTGLSLPKASPVKVLLVERVITVEGEPVADLRDVIPVEYLHKEAVGDNFSGSVLDLLLQRNNLMLSTSRTDIIAEEASSHCAMRRDIPPDPRS